MELHAGTYVSLRAPHNDWCLLGRQFTLNTDKGSWQSYVPTLGKALGRLLRLRCRRDAQQYVRVWKARGLMQQEYVVIP